MSTSRRTPPLHSYRRGTSCAVLPAHQDHQLHHHVVRLLPAFHIASHLDSPDLQWSNSPILQALRHPAAATTGPHRPLNAPASYTTRGQFVPFLPSCASSTRQDTNAETRTLIPSRATTRNRPAMRRGTAATSTRTDATGPIAGTPMPKLRRSVEDPSFAEPATS